MKQVTEVRCSGLSRPMKCAGFLRFENLPTQPTNPAAEEGTAAGELLALKLLNAPIKPQASNGVSFDSDMYFYTTPVAEEILSDIQGAVTCENRIDWETRSGIWIKGSYDISFMRGNKLYIDDLKYGWGIVDVKENWQLLPYAIGRWLQLGMPQVEGVVLRIHQPRPHHEDGTTRTWEITVEQLIEYKEKIELRMLAIAQGDTSLTTGSQCKYCPAMSFCPAFNKATFNAIDVVMSDFKQDNLTPKEISFQLDLLDRASEILKIKQTSLKDLAIDNIKNGILIADYTMETSYGDRKWKSSISPEVIKALTGKDIVETSMLSPAKAEKMGVSKDLVKTFVDRPFLGQKLVRKDSTLEADKIFGGAPKIK